MAKLFSLSSNPNCPCFVLKLPEITVMLDAALDLTPFFQFWPFSLVKKNVSTEFDAKAFYDSEGTVINYLKNYNGQTFLDTTVEVLPPQSDSIDLDEIDVILLSNYKNLLALPFITERCHFRGHIFATDPTLQFGRLLLEEILQYVEIVPKPVADERWKDPKIFKLFSRLLANEPENWCPFFSMDELNNCLNRIKTVSFNENLDLLGLLKATPVSSGYSIGSCNWILDTDYDKFIYVSSSSKLNTHTKSIDVAYLQNADYLIISDLAVTDKNPDRMMEEFCRTAVSTLHQNGNVLAPCQPCGLLFDLLECLCVRLDSAGLSHLPIFVVGHSCESSLAFANIYAEWLSDSKQGKVFLPEEPFMHGYLIKNQRIKVYCACYDGCFNDDFKTPCVVFASHSSLRLGDSTHFMKIWANDPKNVLLLTDPDFTRPEALVPFQPFSMKVLFLPIDTRLNFDQANSLLNEVKPSKVFSHESHLVGQQNSRLQPNTACQLYNVQFPIEVPIKNDFRKIKVDSLLAESIVLKKSMVDSLSLGSVVADVSLYDNKLQMMTPQIDTSTNRLHTDPIFMAYGRPQVQLLIEELTKAGFNPFLKEDTNCLFIILEGQNAYFEITDNSTNLNVEFDNDDTLRIKLRDIFIHCLNRL